MFPRSVPVCFALLLVLSLFSTTDAFADRGRPTASAGTFVTDTGQPLRGPQWSMDYNDGALPYCFGSACSSTPCTYGAASCPMIDAIKAKGLNALHIYVEKQGTTVGSHATNIDQMVNWTSQAGLYLIICLGGGGFGSDDLAHATNFWNFYAPRYKDRTHVLYEVQNEPSNTIFPNTGVIEFERTLYGVIRSKAPNTPVLLFSEGYFQNGPGIVTAID